MFRITFIFHMPSKFSLGIRPGSFLVLYHDIGLPGDATLTCSSLFRQFRLATGVLQRKREHMNIAALFPGDPTIKGYLDRFSFFSTQHFCLADLEFSP
ncbi:hypothetical protein WT08_00260 [Burkholderia sp. MSMB1552]|nr:hypothetical protein WT08_00260 [Burkholderia sp. MSMB1552]KWZ50482.1 hypothetical protein WS92_24130 [Burkholderia sp. MSMB1588]